MRSSNASARPARPAWRGGRKPRRRSTRKPRRRCSSCLRRSKTATMSRTSTPISTWLRTSWRGSAPESAAGARNSRMRVLGLDPGLRHTGWGIIDVDGNRLAHVADGIAPAAAAVEETFVNKNPASTLKLGVARGVVLLAPAERGLPVHEYSANLIKKSVVGIGHADKAQVQMMVRRLLPGCLFTSADAADALAVAICHAHHAATLARVISSPAAPSPQPSPRGGEGE